MTALDSTTDAIINEWEWPSDHLPNTGQFSVSEYSTTRKINVLTQNVLQTPQGHLKEAPGMCGTPVCRNTLMGEQILEFLNDYPLIALQECTEDFISDLKSQLPPHIGYVNAGEMATLYNRGSFRLETYEPFKLNHTPNINCLHTVFKTRHPRHFRVINVHIPNSLTSVSLKETQKVIQALSPQKEEITLLVGDTNLTQDKVHDAICLQPYSNIEQSVITQISQPHGTHSCTVGCSDRILIAGNVSLGSPPPLKNSRYQKTRRALESHGLPDMIGQQQRLFDVAQQRAEKHPDNEELQNHVRYRKAELDRHVNALKLTK